MKKPLTNVRILDLTHMLSGPYASMILADLGAETIKIEPLKGEGTRKLLATDKKNSLDGMGAYFLTLNRNKKSVCIDLKSETGLGIFYELVKTSDVVINNFGPDVPARLKIDYESLKAINPAIITCSVSGFGKDGPGYNRPAFDLVAQAIGGGMSITGKNKDDRVRAGIPIGDLGGGMFAVMGIQAALLERNESGVGQDVDISMLDCQVSLLNYMATMYFLSGENPHSIGNSHFVHVPYDTFATADGEIVIAVITDNFWKNLKQVVNCDDFDNAIYDGQPGRLANRDFINRMLNKILSSNTSEYWLERLEAKRIPCAPVNDLEHALSDKQLIHRNMVVDLKHPGGSVTKGPGNPIKFSRTNEDSFSSPPSLGQHTDEVLIELLDMSKQDLNDLHSQGVIN
jgi:CoA:oxalate CoA-transferase